MRTSGKWTLWGQVCHRLRGFESGSTLGACQPLGNIQSEFGTPNARDAARRCQLLIGNYPSTLSATTTTTTTTSHHHHDLLLSTTIARTAGRAGKTTPAGVGGAEKVGEEG